MAINGAAPIEETQNKLEHEQAQASVATSSSRYEEIQKKIEQYQAGNLNADIVVSELTLEDLKLSATSGPHQDKSVLWLLAMAAAKGKPQGFMVVWKKWKKHISIYDLRSEALEGKDKGQSVLWLLAGAAANGKPQGFMAVWKKWNKYLTLDDVRCEALDGIDKGRSVLWLLAYAASKKMPEGFMAVWEKWKDHITMKDLRCKALAGQNKDRSVLWLLADAASEKKPEGFMAVWEKWKDQITQEDLRCHALTGSNKGMPVLFELAVAASYHHPAGFMAVWDKWKEQITLDDLYSHELGGSDETLSVLWRLFVGSEAYGVSHGERFAWQKWLEHVTLEDLRRQAPDGPHKGKSLLWLIAEVSSLEIPEAFLEVWEKWKDDITLEDLRCKALDGPHKGKSVLWLLANSDVCYTGRFLMVWEKWKDHITLDDLRCQALDGADKGKTVLWSLAQNASVSWPAGFMAVWEKWKNHLTLHDLRSQALEGDEKGQSLLWLLAWAEDDTAFMAIWEKWKDQITLQDLRHEALIEPGKGRSTLWLLAEAASKNEPQRFDVVWERWRARLTIEDFQTISMEGQSALQLLIAAKHPCIEELLTQLPGNFALPAQVPNQPFTFPPIVTAFQVVLGAEINVMSLLFARNAFFNSLNFVKTNPHPSMDELIILQDCAKKALDAGYINAFYELGKYFIDNRRMDEALQCYAKVPMDSFHIAEVNEWMALSWYQEAIKPDTSAALRIVNLEKSLSCALKCPPCSRLNLIKDIAFSYITEGKVRGFEKKDTLPDDLLAVMDGGSSTDWCFKRFDEIKKEWALEQQVKDQEKKIQEQQEKLEVLKKKQREQEEKLTQLNAFFARSDAESQKVIESLQAWVVHSEHKESQATLFPASGEKAPLIFSSSAATQGNSPELTAHAPEQRCLSPR